MTSLGTDDEMLTLLTALAIELPLAIYFALLARRVLRDRDPRQPARVRGHARCTPCRSPPIAREPQPVTQLRSRATRRRPRSRASTSSSESAAESCVRMRAWPSGTTG